MTKKYTIPDSVLSDDIEQWGEHAACKGKPAEWWYTESYVTFQGRMDTQRAKYHCQSCIVRKNCLNHALVNDESYGIWGGLTPNERGYKRKGRAKRVTNIEQ